MFQFSAGKIVVLASSVGVFAFAALISVVSLPVAALLGWDIAAVLFLATVWNQIRRYDETSIAAFATREDPNARIAHVIILGASVACLVGVAAALMHASTAKGPIAGVLIATAVASVVISWVAVHTVYMLHYARLYYTGPDGGIDFSGDKRPTYGDFAYLSFTLGMTYQVSDTAIETKQMRRVVLGHTLLSYLFGTVIVAMTINLVASFVR